MKRHDIAKKSERACHSRLFIANARIFRFFFAEKDRQCSSQLPEITIRKNK